MHSFCHFLSPHPSSFLDRDGRCVAPIDNIHVACAVRGNVPVAGHVKTEGMFLNLH